jgi:hypothetical protein
MKRKCKLDEVIEKAKLVVEGKTIYQDSEGEHELKHWDVFRSLVSKVEQEHIQAKEYKGFPVLSDFYLLFFEIYDDASEREKRMIFHFIVDKWSTLFRHWKVEMDERYGIGKWNKYFE